jgi:hypothetical protein
VTNLGEHLIALFLSGHIVPFCPQDTRAMGKSQKKRSMRRHNPMRVPDSHLPKGLAAAASSSNNKTEAVLPIIKKVRVKFFFLSFLFSSLL